MTLELTRVNQIVLFDDDGKPMQFVNVILMHGSPDHRYDGEYVKYYGSAGARESDVDPDWKPLLN